jgi:hypothetical protein
MKNRVKVFTLTLLVAGIPLQSAEYQTVYSGVESALNTIPNDLSDKIETEKSDALKAWQGYDAARKNIFDIATSLVQSYILSVNQVPAPLEKLFKGIDLANPDNLGLVPKLIVTVPPLPYTFVTTDVDDFYVNNLNGVMSSLDNPVHFTKSNNFTTWKINQDLLRQKYTQVFNNDLYGNYKKFNVLQRQLIKDLVAAGEDNADTAAENLKEALTNFDDIKTKLLKQRDSIIANSKK